MRLIIKLIFGLSLLSVSAFAKSDLVSKASFSTKTYKFEGELYYDKAAKKVDLWVSHTKGVDTKKVEFKASSLLEKMRDVQFKLISVPAIRESDVVLQTFDSYSVATSEFYPDAGFSLMFKAPVKLLSREFLTNLLKNYPTTLVYNDRKQPLYVKCLVNHATAYQVYPIAAFDVSEGLDLLSSQ